MRDTPVYVDMGPLGATVVHTLSDDRERVAPEEWEKKRFGMFCVESTDFSDSLAILLKLCRMSKRCKFEERKLIKEAAVRFLELNGRNKSNPSELELELEVFNVQP